MAICFVNDNGTNRLESASYATEQELEDIIAANPYLLLGENEPELSLIAGQVNLPGSGIADLLFLDASGRLTVVEVKLLRNAESRRVVVGQVFDYVSTLADRTLFEIDEMTGGSLETALREFGDPDADAGSYEALRRGCSTSLRAGDVRVAVVMDDAPDELVRIMSFMNDHSDLDVRLITVQKHQQAEGQVYVPRLVVTASEEKKVGRRTQRQMSSKLAEVVAEFDRQQPDGLSTASSRATGWRQVQLPSWPKSFHYEFVDGGDSILVDFHQEHRGAGSFVGVFRALEPKVREAFPDREVRVDPERWKGLGGLSVTFPATVSTEEIVKGMARLIGVTRALLDQEIKARKSAT